MKSKTIKIGFIISLLVVQFFGLSFAFAATSVVDVTANLGSHTSDKSPFQLNESFGININTSSLYASSGSVQITTSVKGVQVGSFAQSKNSLGQLQTQNGITVTDANGFVNGANTVAVSITDSSTNQLLGIGSIVVQATGLSGSGGNITISTAKMNTDKTSYSIGDTMTVTVSNMGTNVASGQACINAGNQCFEFTNSGGSATVQIPVTTDEYFQTSGSNTVSVNLFDSSDNALPSPQGNPISVTTGTAAASTTCTPACTAPQTCVNGTCQTAAGGQGNNSSVKLINPISKFDNLTALLVNIMKGFLGIIAVWAVAFIVIGGFRMVISSGNEEAVLAAKKTITWAVLGLLVAVLSFAIIAIVQNLVGVNIPATTTSNPITPPTNPITPPSNPITP
jgi:hypothetical protein